MKHSIRWDRRKYSEEVLLGELALIEWTTNVNNVQNMWDEFESKLVKIVDKIMPLTDFVNHKVKKPIPNEIKHKINQRKRLLKQRKKAPNDEIKHKFYSLNADIKTFYFTQKRNSIRNFSKHNLLFNALSRSKVIVCF